MQVKRREEVVKSRMRLKAKQQPIQEVPDPPEGPPKAQTYMVKVGVSGGVVTFAMDSASIPSTAHFVRWDFGTATGSVVLKSASGLLEHLQPWLRGMLAEIRSGRVSGTYTFDVTVGGNSGTGTLVV